MSGEVGGVVAGLDEAISEAGELLPDGHDLVQSLFSPEEVGDLAAASPLSGAFEPKRRGKGGRPPGSRNRRTEAVAAYLLSQHRHPLQVVMEIYSMSPVELAERAGLRKTKVHEPAPGEPAYAYSNDVLMELIKFQARCAEAALPYVAQKLPQAVQLDAKGHVQLTLGGVLLPARGQLAEGGGPVIEGEFMGVTLPKSDDTSRTDG